jgi:hypothetical protein
MTIKLSLAPASSLARRLLLFSSLPWQGVIPLSRTAFLRQPELLCEAMAQHCSHSWLAHPPKTRCC